MKKILLIIIFLFPLFIKAQTCDYNKQQENLKLSYNIEYEKKYDMDDGTFRVILHNVYNGIYLIYDNRVYYPDSNNIVAIDNIKEGSYIDISINSSYGDCKSFLRTLSINFGYYNEYYYSEKCYDYRDKLSICNSEFLSYKPSEELLDKNIENYEKAYKEEQKKVEEEEPQEKKYEILQKVYSFIDEWGIQIIILIVTTMVMLGIFRVKFRKVKHGI